MDTPTPCHTELTAEFDELGLAVPKQDGPAPRYRLKDADKLRSIHRRFFDDDRLNAYNRALCQSLLDGEPPYNQDELNDAGQPDTTNLNFQGAEKKLERAKSPYYRLFNSGEKLVSLQTLYGPEDERPNWEAIIEEEVTNTIRNCDEFPYEADRLIHKFVWEGVGIGSWTDDRDWRFKAYGQGQFYFPRQVAATESKQEIVTYETEITITELFAKINREQTGGWDKEVAKKAILKATSEDRDYANWEKLMEEVKNNDLFVGSRLPTIKVVGGYIKEFDGKVSHCIAVRDGEGEKKFLFHKHNAYNSMSEALILFPYGAGTNTKLHGIRGLGYKLYAFEQQLNRSICRLIDQGEFAGMITVQAESETDYANLGLEYIGNLAALPPNWKIVTPSMPDLQRTVMPAIEMMQTLGNDRTAGYSPENVFDGNQRKTKFEVSAQLEQASELSSSSIDFFYTPGDRLIQQMLRRMIRRDWVASDPGGPEILDLHLRLVRRGVPLEALYRVDWKRSRLMRVIGAGSAAAKTLGLQRLEVLRPRMDDVGQLELDRELAIDAVGLASVDKFFPRDGVFRTSVDTQIAILQNAQLMEGLPIPVLSSDKHLAHAREHMKPLVEMYEAAQGGQIPLAEAATTHAELFSHTVEHVQMVDGDVAASEEAAAMRQMLQRIEEVISNGLKEAEAAREEAEAMPEGEEIPAEAAPEALSAEAQSRLAKAQAEIEVMRLKAREGIALEQEKTRARIAMDDAKAAAEIRRKGIAPR